MENSQITTYESHQTPTYSYKNLIVYQKAKLLTKDVMRFFSKNKLPRSLDFLASQLMRSVSSIGANIAEGHGRHYRGSYKQFIGVARGSSFETDYWLDIIGDLKVFDTATLSEFVQRNLELTKMLTKMMKNLDTT